jgi:DNA (cytosine-5)-methyltransferase 1
VMLKKQSTSTSQATQNRDHHDMDTAINHLSLCTGFAGIDLGIKRVLPTCRTITYVEIEAFAIANLVEKMEKGKLDSAPVWTDLRTFNGKPYRGKVDVLSGGFPCQPFSQAGKHLADSDPRHLFPTIKRIIREVRPGLVFLENVEGIISSKLRGQEGTSVLLHVLGELESLGFTATWGMFSAQETGAPHRRNRVFIAAVANGDSGRLEGFSKRNDQDRSDAQGINPDRCNKGLADTNDKRLEGWSKPITKCVDQWPSGQGSSQRPHEQPRTIEPRLGGTTDGDSSWMDKARFRVDRLRLLGNGVVPATAEVAFRTLFTQLREDTH